MAKQTFTTGQVLTAAQMTSLQQTAMGGGAATAKTASYVLVAADAGTVIQMNAAGATTITVNTSLFAAGDSVQIQNIGAGVCTVTAGTATVTTAGSLALSQWEGGQLYFTSTSASIFLDIVQSSGMTNPLTTTGDTIYSSSGTTPARLGIGTTGQVLTVAGGVPSWATAAASVPSNSSATVATDQSTTSTSFTDLATSGPAVTVTTGTKALVIFAAEIYQTGANLKSYVAAAVSGATTVAASNAKSYLWQYAASGQETRAGTATMFTGLTAGSNTFTLKYKVASGTGNFGNREIIVIDMGS